MSCDAFIFYVSDEEDDGESHGMPMSCDTFIFDVSDDDDTSPITLCTASTVGKNKKSSRRTSVAPKAQNRRMDAFVKHPPAVKREREECDDGRPTVVEIFAGAGGMSLGLEQAGFRHVALVERNLECVNTLRANDFRHVICSDASFEDYSGFAGADLVAGGPPCQPFSVAGVDKGADDDRDGWPTAIRAVREIKPRAFLFENVAGMMRDKFQAYRDNILKQFHDLGYSVHIHVIDAADYGIAQHRRRLFMVGFEGVRWFRKPPPIEGEVTLRQALQALGPPNGLNDHVLHKASPRAYGSHCGSSLDKPSKTLLAGSGGPGGGSNMFKKEDGTYRYYTLREMARLQSFPDSYKVHKTWSRGMHQMGNACPPKLARLFAEEILCVLGVRKRSVTA